MASLEPCLLRVHSIGTERSELLPVSVAGRASKANGVLGEHDGISRRGVCKPIHGGVQLFCKPLESSVIDGLEDGSTLDSLGFPEGL